MGRNKVIGGGGFHHLAIKVADFDGAVKFYTEGLGFVAAARWGEGDGRAILLDTGDGNYFELFAGGKPSAGEVGPMVHVALRSDNVDAAIARAKAAGAVVTMEPKDVDIPSTPPLPVRIAFCKAPGGEVLEFFHHRKG